MQAVTDIDRTEYRSSARLPRTWRRPAPGYLAVGVVGWCLVVRRVVESVIG